MKCCIPALLLLAAACGSKPDGQTDLDSLDRELTDASSTGQRDPAVARALHDQIIVDPTLAQRSNANAVRPPARPDDGAVPPDLARPDPVDARALRHAPAPGASCPDCAAKGAALTLGALAANRGGRTADCANEVRYSAGWANRLPGDLPLYPDARVTEAAGNDARGCRLRVVSFASSAAATKVIDWYFTHATAGHYSAEHQAQGALHVLGGTRGDDAYVVYATPRQGGGTDVDLVSNAGS